MKTIYLAGPINGCTDTEALEWRQFAEKALNADFKILSPMSRDYRGREHECVNEIVEGDKADIDASDIVLAMAHTPSVGTSMEVHYAWERGKTVVGIVGWSNPSPWLRYHSKVLFPRLSDAVTWLQVVAK